MLKRYALLGFAALLAACSSPPPPPPAPSFTLSANPTSVNLLPGQSAPVTVSVTRNSTFTSAVTVSLSNPPTGLVANAVTIPAAATSGVLTVQNISAAAGTNASITVAGASGEVTSTATLAFSSAAIPAVSNISPAFALPGETVTVTGTGFAAGATAKVGTLPANVTITNDTSATVTIPQGARGPSVISITAPAGTSTTTANVFVGKALTLDGTPSTDDIRKELVKLPDGTALQLPAATYVSDAQPLQILNRSLYGAGDTTIIRGNVQFFGQGDTPLEISGIKFEDASPTYQYGAGGLNTTSLQTQATANGTVVLKNVKMVRITAGSGTLAPFPGPTNLRIQDSTVQLGGASLFSFGGNLEIVNSNLQLDTSLSINTQGGNVRIEGSSITAATSLVASLQNGNFRSEGSALTAADAVVISSIIGDIEVLGLTVGNTTTGSTVRATDGTINLATTQSGRLTIKNSTVEAKQDLARAGGGSPDIQFISGGRVTLDANPLIKADQNIVVNLAAPPPPVSGGVSGADVFITNNQQITADGVAGGTFTGILNITAPAGSITITGNQKLEADGPIQMVSQFGDINISNNPGIRSASGQIVAVVQGAPITSPPVFTANDLVFNNNTVNLAIAPTFANVSNGITEFKGNTFTVSSTTPGTWTLQATANKRVTVQQNNVTLTDTDANSSAAFAIISASVPTSGGVNFEKTQFAFNNNTINAQGDISSVVQLVSSWANVTSNNNTLNSKGAVVLAEGGAPTTWTASNNTITAEGGTLAMQVAGGIPASAGPPAVAADPSVLTFSSNTVNKASVIVAGGDANNVVSITGNTIKDVPTNGTGLNIGGSGTYNNNTISALAGSTTTRGISIAGGGATASTITVNQNTVSGFTRAVYFVAGGAASNVVTVSNNNFTNNAATNFIELDAWTAAKGVINAATGNTWPGAVTPAGTNVVLTNAATIAGISL